MMPSEGPFLFLAQTCLSESHSELFFRSWKWYHAGLLDFPDWLILVGPFPLVSSVPVQRSLSFAFHCYGRDPFLVHFGEKNVIEAARISSRTPRFRFPWRTVSLFSVFARLLSIAIQISCWVSFSKLLLLEETVFTAGIETIVLDLLIYIMTNHFFQSRLTGQCFFLHCILLIQSHERSQFLKVLELEQNFQFVFVWIFSWREQVVAVKKECRLYHLYWRSQRSCKRFIFHSWIDSRVFSWSSVLETVLVTPSLDFAS